MDGLLNTINKGNIHSLPLFSQDIIKAVISQITSKTTVPRRAINVYTGEYGLWYYNEYGIPSTLYPEYKRIVAFSHYKKTRVFVLNIDRKEGLCKIRVNLSKHYQYTLYKGTRLLLESNSLIQTLKSIPQ